ncbi:histone-lysine N-methyltransferase 2D [Brachypodium distachyon]|uniref:Uncharacterized protein n=1 Tax=Brachypodium distachyon TaxID=15368 RepID=I1IRG7_BRADI|nr:histone-lysine N-methyltransferase 2D [Brachypodium distachyon]KQJ90869.1 hypothetical protein BRADI_4g34250v3 [Brachypodium distachyon]|eukprot:XP_003576695.1 histone-lysine N-methyltransferase 2D [Brachypodium distachyon]
MASFADEEALPALPPINTAPLLMPPSPPAADPSRETTTATTQESAEERDPSTPKSEESKIRPAAECPPAPRKPALATAPRLSAVKRKWRPSSTGTTRVCVAVPRDLSTVFRSMPMRPPPEKRIRAS